MTSKIISRYSLSFIIGLIGLYTLYLSAFYGWLSITPEQNKIELETRSILLMTLSIVIIAQAIIIFMISRNKK
jgi:magnesium-transporting ATPase (P-type)